MEGERRLVGERDDREGTYSFEGGKGELRDRAELGVGGMAQVKRGFEGVKEQGCGSAGKVGDDVGRGGSVGDLSARQE